MIRFSENIFNFIIIHENLPFWWQGLLLYLEVMQISYEGFQHRFGS